MERFHRQFSVWFVEIWCILDDMLAIHWGQAKFRIRVDRRPAILKKVAKKFIKNDFLF
ncbi:MAG: hypothetical protein LBP19_06640 [Treponema sp.]|jgi:hypothetical protein|nr:hypothetical protein [Treponema sp.]